MTLSQPFLSPDIKQKLNVFLNNVQAYLNNSDYYDATIEIVGYLKSCNGAKICINNIEKVSNDDIDIWIKEAKDSGAISVNHIIDLNSGTIVFYIEYKRTSNTNYIEWLIYPTVITILMFLQHQLV